MFSRNALALDDNVGRSLSAYFQPAWRDDEAGFFIFAVKATQKMNILAFAFAKFVGTLEEFRFLGFRGCWLGKFGLTLVGEALECRHHLIVRFGWRRLLGGASAN